MNGENVVMNYFLELIASIDNILSIVGFFSLITVLVRVIWVLFAANTEWVSSISMRVIKNEEMLETAEDGDSIFAEEYCTEGHYITRLMFRPHDSIIRTMVLSRVQYKNGNYVKPRLIKEKVFRDITPQHPLVIGTEMAETFPHYALTWKGDYGIKATYYFHVNNRDGNYQTSGMTYTIGFWTKIRKILELK